MSADELQQRLAQDAEQRRLWRAMRAQQTYTIASIMNLMKYLIIVQERDWGLMTSPCVYCFAKHFTNESTRKVDGFTLCCCKSKVQLPPLFAGPAQLQQLYQGNDGKYRNFRDNIRSCNLALLQTQLFQISGIYKQTVFHMCMDMYSHMTYSHVM